MSHDTSLPEDHSDFFGGENTSTVTADLACDEDGFYDNSEFDICRTNVRQIADSSTSCFTLLGDESLAEFFEQPLISNDEVRSLQMPPTAEIFSHKPEDLDKTKAIEQQSDSFADNMVSDLWNIYFDIQSHLNLPFDVIFEAASNSVSLPIQVVPSAKEFQSGDLETNVKHDETADALVPSLPASQSSVSDKSTEDDSCVLSHNSQTSTESSDDGVQRFGIGTCSVISHEFLTYFIEE